jgi:hypothetical protein
MRFQIELKSTREIATTLLMKRTSPDAQQQSIIFKHAKITLAPLTSLPDDALLHILLFLSGYEICSSICRVSCHFQQLIDNNDYIFKRIAIREGVHISPLCFDFLTCHERFYHANELDDVIIKSKKELLEREDICWYGLYNTVMNEQSQFITTALFPFIRNRRKFKPNISRRQALERIEIFERKTGLVIPSIWRLIMMYFGWNTRVKIGQHKPNKSDLALNPQMFSSNTLVLIATVEQSNDIYECLSAMLKGVPLYGKWKTEDTILHTSWLQCGYSDDQINHFFVNCDPTSDCYGQVANVSVDTLGMHGGFMQKDWWVQLKHISALEFRGCGSVLM